MSLGGSPHGAGASLVGRGISLFSFYFVLSVAFYVYFYHAVHKCHVL